MPVDTESHAQISPDMSSIRSSKFGQFAQQNTQDGSEYFGCYVNIPMEHLSRIMDYYPNLSKRSRNTPIRLK